MTVKSAMQSYLERFFKEDGCYRKQLQQTAPYSIQYETGISGSKDISDPTVYELQLARLWKELRQKLPCILIVDQEFKYDISGLGGISGSFLFSRKTSSIELKMDCSVTMLIEVAAWDETTCSDLRDLLVYIFGPLTIANKSHVIRSSRNQDRWEIRLPQAFDPQGLERKNVEGDSKDSFWISGIELTVDFEGTIDLAFANQTQLVTVGDFREGMIPNGFDEDGVMTYIPAEGTPSLDSISVPTEVILGRPVPVTAHWIPAQAIFISDDPRVAIVDEKGVIIPKRLGRFRIHLMDYGKNTPEALLTWEVQVKTM